MKYSVIVPVYNRPDEVKELLESLRAQTFRDFEVILVEDGSSVPCEDIAKDFSKELDIKYFTKENSGPGQTRNYGAERAVGEYLIILDSDVMVPPGYFEAIEAELTREPADAFGGPDRAHKDFTPVQKAINYAMTSFFTTGGIRGGKVKMDKFYPRSFNLGISASAYVALGGFSKMRFGEDIDLSIRIFKNNYRCRLFPDAWVWHKRRTNLKKFFKQVHNSGIARINLYKKYPESLKLVHMLPSAFTIGIVMLLIVLLPALLIFSGLPWWASVLIALSPLLVWSAAVFTDSSIKNKSPKIGLLSIAASFIQLTGYGSGFLRAWWLRCVCGRGEELQAFRKTFYK
ncbi:MAG: glycosyltransferase [Bacteroidales bacterium]|nr:glycosyltransferase [Bacteroidales bacterium]